MCATALMDSDCDAMMGRATLSQRYNYQQQQQQQQYSNGRSNVDKTGSCSQWQQQQEDSFEDINDIDLGRSFDVNAIERRLGDCFGNMRKNFEGEYIGEKRGPKFGYYGSFLPTQERPPQRHQQANSPVPVHNYSSQTTVNEGAVEKSPRLAVTDVPWRIGSIGCRNSSLHDSTFHDFTKETLAVNGVKVDDFTPMKKQSVNGFRLRFKVGSDTIALPKNNAIYTGLGLQNSSSISLEDSPDKGQKPSTEVESPLDSSPISIIRFMTSYQVPGGSLLSPLQNILKEGQGKVDFSSKDIKGRTGQVQVKEARVANSSGIEYGNGIQAPMPKKDMTTGIFESKKEPNSQFTGDKVKKVKKDAGTKCRISKASNPIVSKSSSKFSIKELHQGKPEMGIACNVETDIHRGGSLATEEPNILANGKDFSACLSKDGNIEADAARDPGRSSKTEKGSMPGCVNEIHKNQEEEHTKEPKKEIGHKDVSDVRKISKLLKKVNEIGLSEASAYKEKNMLNEKSNRVPKEKVPGRVDTLDKVVVNTEHVKDIGMKNKNSHDINMLNKAMKEASKEVTKYKFKASVNEEPRGNKGQKEPAKTNSKDLHANGANYKNELVDIKKETSMAHCIESTKQARQKHFERELSREIEREKKRDVADEYNSKKLECVSNIKSHVSKEVDTQSLPERSATQDPATVSSLGFDDWVCCDACEKWRLCPIGLKLSALPKKWLCHMMFWLPGMNHCDVPQEETTQAVYNRYTITQTQVHSESNQGNVQLPATVSTALPDPKPSNQILPGILQSRTKFRNNKKGLVQRSMPNVSGTVKFSNSLTGHSPVKNKSDLYKWHTEQEDGNMVFSQCEDEGKSNGVIKEKNKIKEKMKLKRTSGGQAYDIEVGNAHTLNVKRKRDSDLKECKPTKKMKAKDDLVHDAEGVDSLCLRSERTDHGFKILKNDKLTKENCVESMSKESKFKDQQQATKKRKLKEGKEGKITHQGLLETNRMVDCQVGEEEKQPAQKRIKALKTESSQPHASKEFEHGKEQKVKSVSSNLEHMRHEIEDHGMKQYDEHGLMQMAADHTEPLKKESSCRPPFVSTTSSSSKFSCYPKSLGIVPDRRGSPVESSVSSSPARNLKAEKLSLARSENVGKDDLMDSCNLMMSSPRRGSIGDVQSDHFRLIRRTKDLCKAPGTNEKFKVDKSTSNMCKAMNNSGGRDGKQFPSTKPKDECLHKHLTSNGNFRVQERGNEKAKCDMVVDMLDYESMESKHDEDSFIRKCKAGAFSGKDRRLGLCYFPGEDKSKTSPHSANRSEGRGDDSRVDILFYKGNQLEGSLIDASSGESSRVPRESGTCCKGTSCPQLKSPTWNGFVGRGIWSSTANAALQEGRVLKQKADGLKSNGGDELGFISFYFRASLKFLQSASILEPLNADSARHRENKSMALFAYSARLSEDCAKMYERNGKWAAATLAYQCTGVAHMHVVMANTASISRDRRELESAVVLIPTGESPRSSASDVDNLNCRALTVKDSYVNREIGVTSPHASGNYVIDTQHCQHYNRMLQFVDDTNAAFEAFAKANIAFAAAKESSYEEQEISAVTMAINLNFHNVDGLLRLVLPLMELIDL